MKKTALILLLGVAFSTFAFAKNVNIKKHAISTNLIHVIHKAPLAKNMQTYYFPLICGGVVTVSNSPEISYTDYALLWSAFNSAMCGAD